MAAPEAHNSSTACEPAQSDAELTERLRAGDEAAFEEIYERYFKRIYHFVDRRLGNRADTEETTQEVFINVFSSIASYRGEAPFVAWIFGITRRTIAGRFKRKHHPTISLTGSDDDSEGSSAFSHQSSDPSPLESYEYRERIKQISTTLERRLTSEQQILFELHHMQDIPIGEIAQTLNKSENSIKSNLYRTRKLLLSR